MLVFLTLQCPPCTGESSSCGGHYMICLSEVRMCVCADGYHLDVSGVECVLHKGGTTSQQCEKARDCSLIPNTICLENRGEDL